MTREREGWRPRVVAKTRWNDGYGSNDLTRRQACASGHERNSKAVSEKDRSSWSPRIYDPCWDSLGALVNATPSGEIYRLAERKPIPRCETQ